LIDFMNYNIRKKCLYRIISAGLFRSKLKSSTKARWPNKGLQMLQIRLSASLFLSLKTQDRTRFDLAGNSDVCFKQIYKRSFVNIFHHIIQSEIVCALLIKLAFLLFKIDLCIHIRYYTTWYFPFIIFEKFFIQSVSFKPWI
jgi:hypothetical protein